jgi:hypothetical protein
VAFAGAMDSKLDELVRSNPKLAAEVNDLVLMWVDNNVHREV